MLVTKRSIQEIRNNSFLSKRKRLDRSRGHLLRLTLLLGSTALAALSSTMANAQTVWNGLSSMDWNTAANWSTNAVPTAVDDVFIDSITNHTTFIGTGIAASTDSLVIGDSSAGVLTIGGGGTLTSGGTVAVGLNAGSVGLALVDGTGSTWTIIGTNLLVGQEGTGTLTIQNGGAVNAVNVVIADNTGSTGTIAVTGTGSTMSLTGDLYVGNGTNGSNGTLTIADGATVSNMNGELGGNFNAVGMVTVTGVGSTWSNSGSLRVGNVGFGTLTIANGGVVIMGAGAGTLTIASGASSTGAVNIGNGGAAGTLNAAAVQFGAGTGTLNFNHTEANYSFAPTISGNGTINQLAGVTKLTGNSSAFTGTTNVSGGSLYVNGSLGGTVNVTGGLLGGSGIIGALTIGSGGTVAPGNSIGTLNVATMTFNAGSTYTVELNDAGNAPGVNNDHINATGAVTINGGAVHVTPVNGTDNGKTYTVGAVYTIVTAAGGVTGAFTTVSDDYAFLNFTLSYDVNNVYLTSRLADLCLVGYSANQCGVANGVMSLGSGALFNAVLNLSDAEAPGALNQLSGEIHASAKAAFVDDSRFVREAATNRVRGAFGGVATNAMPVMAYAASGHKPTPVSTGRFATWGHAFGAWGHWDGDANAARLGRSTGGFFLGGDALVADFWRLGLMAGYSRTSFDVDDRASSGSADNYHLGAYGGTQWGRLGLRFGAAYTWHDIDMSRSVAFTGFSDRLNADYRAGTAQAFGEAGYRLDAAAMRFEPFAGLAYVRLRSDAFTEQGGAAALTSASGIVDATFTTLGLRAERQFVTGNGLVTTKGTLGWRHAFGDVTPTSVFNFAGGSAFTIAGTPIARDAAVVDAGLDVAVTGAATVGLTYNGQIASDAATHAFKANLGVRF